MADASHPVMLITGTSRGLGKYLADYYLAKGYRVVGCSRGCGAIEADRYKHFQVDISDSRAVLDMFGFLRKEYKRLDVLINNAAINPAIVSAALLPTASVEHVFKVNVFAAMECCRESVKIMLRGRFGRIVNLGSMATRHEVPGEALYTATKAAMLAYTRVLAKELGESGITANVVAPAALRTDLSAQVSAEALGAVLSRNAIKSYGDFSDVSGSIDFLLSPSSAAVTGQLIYLGGA